jgi:hypothetical protein
VPLDDLIWNYDEQNKKIGMIPLSSPVPAFQEGSNNWSQISVVTLQKVRAGQEMNHSRHSLKYSDINFPFYLPAID